MDPIRSEFEDDPDMMEIVREFAAELPERATALEEALAREDFEQIRVLSHQLKGAGGGYGFQPVTDAAAVLEEVAKSGGDAAALKDPCDRLCETLRAVVVSEGD